MGYNVNLLDTYVAIIMAGKGGLKGEFFDKKSPNWDKLFTQFKGGAGGTVQVGYLRSGLMHKPKKGQRDTKSITMAHLAAIHEFGTKFLGHYIPERSFMRSSVDENKNKINRLISKLAGMIIDGNMTPYKALHLIGQTIRDNMVHKINTGPFKTNSSYTIQRKGSSKPLIDTGQLKGSIDVVVVKGRTK